MKKIIQFAKDSPRLSVLWRILLAAIGGFVLISVFIAGLASFTSATLGVAKEPIMLWLMLLAIVLYCVLIMWIFATRKLLRCTLVVVFGIAISTAALYGGDYLAKVDMEQQL